VTEMTYAFSLFKRKIKEKRKENQYKIRKIKEKKKKIVSVQASHNIGMIIDIEDLKCDSHKSSSKHTLAILIILPKHASLLIIHLR